MDYTANLEEENIRLKKEIHELKNFISLLLFGIRNISDLILKKEASIRNILLTRETVNKFINDLDLSQWF